MFEKKYRFCIQATYKSLTRSAYAFVLVDMIFINGWFLTNHCRIV